MISIIVLVQPMYRDLDSTQYAGCIQSLLAGIPVHVKPELPPLSLFMRGDVPEAHIETDSMATAHTLVAAANENGGQITYEMLVDFYNKVRLENGNPQRNNVVGFQPLHSRNYDLQGKRNDIVTQVRDEILAEQSGRFSSAKPNESNCWPESDDSTGEGPAPRRPPFAYGGLIAMDKPLLVGEHSGCDLFSYPRYCDRKCGRAVPAGQTVCDSCTAETQQKPATTERRSIDDCSPQEWDDASRATYARMRGTTTQRCRLGHGLPGCCFGHRLDTNGCMQAGCLCNPDTAAVQEPANPVETSNPTNPSTSRPQDVLTPERVARTRTMLGGE